MFNWDKAVDKKFGKAQDNNQSFESLLENLFGQLTAELLTEVKDENTQDAKGKFRLPPFKISQNWGQPDTLDRQRISKFMRNIQGEDFKQKLEFVNSILSSEFGNNQTIPQILSTMVFVESLNSIVQEFEASSSGFLFESFVAALLGRGAKQIPGTKQIEDIEDINGKLYSLKLIQKGSGQGATRWEKEGSSIGGSFQNLVKLFASKKSVHYLVGLKEDKGGLITFGQFTMSQENFISALRSAQALPVEKISGLTLDALKKTLAGQGTRKIPFRLIRKIIDDKEQVIFSSEEGVDASEIEFSDIDKKVDELKIDKTSKFTIVGNELDLIKQLEDIFSSNFDTASLDEKFMNSLKGMKFSISQEQMIKFATYEELGKLDLTENSLKQLWINYAELLEQTVAPVYRAFDKFSTNLENYFTSPASEEAQTRKYYGDQAIDSSYLLADQTNKTITNIENE